MKTMLLHEDRLFPAETNARKVARSLYAHIQKLPIISPHTGQILVVDGGFLASGVNR